MKKSDITNGIQRREVTTMNTSVLLIKQLVFEEMQRRYPEDYDDSFIKHGYKRNDSYKLFYSFYIRFRGALYHVPIDFEDMIKLGNFASAKYLIEQFEMLRRL